MIIIICNPDLISLTAVLFQNIFTVIAKRRELTSSIQYGYIKCGTHAWGFSPTFAHGNSKFEIRQRNRGSVQAEKNENWRSTAVTKKSSPDCLTVQSHFVASSRRHVSHWSPIVTLLICLLFKKVVNTIESVSSYGSLYSSGIVSSHGN